MKTVSPSIVDGVDGRQRRRRRRLLGKAAAPAAKDQHEGQDHTRGAGGHYDRGTSLAPWKFRRTSLRSRHGSQGRSTTIATPIPPPTQSEATP